MSKLDLKTFEESIVNYIENSKGRGSWGSCGSPHVRRGKALRIQARGDLLPVFGHIVPENLGTV